MCASPLSYRESSTDMARLRRYDPRNGIDGDWLARPCSPLGYGDLDVPNIPVELHGLSYTKLKDFGYSSICAFYDECQEFEYEDYMRVFSEEFESGILRSRHSGDHTKNRWNSDYYSRTEVRHELGVWRCRSSTRRDVSIQFQF